MLVLFEHLECLGCPKFLFKIFYNPINFNLRFHLMQCDLPDHLSSFEIVYSRVDDGHKRDVIIFTNITSNDELEVGDIDQCQ